MTRALLVAAIAGVLTTPAAADEILCQRGETLLRVPVAGGDPTELGTLPAGASLQLSASGQELLASTASAHVWLSVANPRPRALACFGPGSLAAGRVACASGTGAILVTRLSDHARTVIAADPEGARLVGDRLIAAAGNGIAAIDLRSRERTPRAPHRPTSHLLIAPDGSRAVGVYPDGDSTAVFGFRLDGVAARRKLISKTEPVAWSGDSRWLLVQRGERACIVRAVGGQYKCWKRYRAVAIAPDGAWAVMARPRDDGDGFDLFVGELEGASAKRPRLLIEDVGPTAAWL